MITNTTFIPSHGWAKKKSKTVRLVVPITNAHRRSPNPLLQDPTRTKTLRRTFENDLVKRFSRLKRKLYELIVVADAFGLSVENALTTNVRWAFLTSAEKLQQFQAWLALTIQADILLGASATEGAYWRRYVEEGYRKGAGKAFDQVKVARRAEALAERSGTEYLQWYQGTREQFLASSFGQPETVEKIQLLTSRTFTDLKNVTEAMSTAMSRTLVDGLTQGKGTKAIARDLAKHVDGIGKNRARLIARSEIIRAHAEGALDSMEQMGVEEVGVMVEWSSVPDSRRCQLCASLEGVVLKIKEMRGLIPRHPQCRCSVVPANVGESTTDQIRGKTRIRQAIDRSIKAEIPKRSKRSLARQKTLTKWAGADKRVTKKRPKSIV